MASNDYIVLDGILEDYQRINNNLDLSMGEAFERFVFEQVLKDYALSANRIDDGWVDGNGDGGVDGVFIMVNGYPFNGEDSFQWPKENPHITVWIFTCKHGNEFVQAPLESMYTTLKEFWDLSKKEDELNGVYSDELMEARNVFSTAYTALGHLDPLVDVKIIYASRGNSSQVSDSVKGRMAQLETQVKDAFSKASAEGIFVGSADLLSLYRKAKDENLALPFQAFLTHDDNNYVVIATLKDYFDFVKDGDGKLRRYLFDSNVRDFLGYNSVNSDIDFTLKHPTAANFWWLNNGITILATNAHVQGRMLHIKNVQIVNGLQTTETLYRHFKAGAKDSLDKNILIKILTSQDVAVRENIIQATNNQSNVMSYSLHATDDVQRNIEEILQRNEIYYERRDHYYKNEGKPKDSSITPLELAKSFMSVVYRNPAKALKLKNRFMRNCVSYRAVFDSSMSPDRWPVLARLWLDAGRSYRQQVRFTLGGADLSHQWIPLVVYCAVSVVCGKFNYTIGQFNKMAIASVEMDVFTRIWQSILPYVREYSKKAKLKNARSVYDLVINNLARLFGLKGQRVANKRPLQTVEHDERQANQEKRFTQITLTEELLKKIKNKLPPQPWKPGVHRKVSAELKLHPSLVHEAIEVLISREVVFPQRDGIVFDHSGLAIRVDPDRCPYSVEEINSMRIDIHS